MSEMTGCRPCNQKTVAKFKRVSRDIMSTLGDFEAILQSKAVIDLHPDLEHADLH